MALIQAKPFRLALLQLAGLSANKASNIAVARKAVAAAAASVPKPDLIVLPEIWNSPYAVTAFREYSERVPSVQDGQEVAGGAEGETVAAMREMARAAGTFLIGGESRTAKAGKNRLADDQAPFPSTSPRATPSTTRSPCTIRRAAWLPSIARCTCSTLTSRAARRSRCVRAWRRHPPEWECRRRGLIGAVAR